MKSKSISKKLKTVFIKCLLFTDSFLSESLIWDCFKIFDEVGLENIFSNQRKKYYCEY